MILERKGLANIEVEVTFHRKDREQVRLLTSHFLIGTEMFAWEFTMVEGERYYTEYYDMTKSETPLSSIENLRERLTHHAQNFYMHGEVIIRLRLEYDI